MSEELAGVERERQMLIDAEAQGTGAKLEAYVKLSGPGWLQSAITLGGGSLASSLFLGILAGYHLLWLQIFAMICGVTMLGAIGYVALSTGERPFKLINERINPVLGWGWALATLAANIVWCLPQFSLAEAAVSQNLAPGLSDMKWLTCGVVLVIAVGVTSLYGSGGKGLRVYENLLRVMVALIVISFFGVVVTLLAKGGIAVGDIFAGLIPNFSMFNNPSPQVEPLVSATGDFSDYWRNLIVYKQRDVMVSAAATAVGINMTFLFPYSLLKKKWDRHFRGLSLFDLATGMAIPFVVATGCVVIAAGSSFHGKPSKEIVDNWPDNRMAIDGKLRGDFEKLLTGRLKAGGVAPAEGDALIEQLKTLPESDRNVAATIANRNALTLAKALSPLTGEFVANYVFGFGVLAMALSTITILMLISGFTICEVLGQPQDSVWHRIGALLPAIGVIGPFYWKSAAAYLAVPTSVFGMALLPIAYFTFFILMNSRNALGDDLPQGNKRLMWNIMMAIACAFSTVGAGWAVWSKVAWKGVAGFAVFILVAAVVHFMRPPRRD
ncbi:MAG: hypothetical protein CMJ78_20690 [Planctomycetaceae bacterium]|nr:hypothetical protein [Planctomycetaceae bacterium]